LSNPQQVSSAVGWVKTDRRWLAIIALAARDSVCNQLTTKELCMDKAQRSGRRRGMLALRDGNWTTVQRLFSPHT